MPNFFDRADFNATQISQGLLGQARGDTDTQPAGHQF